MSEGRPQLMIVLIQNYDLGSVCIIHMHYSEPGLLHTV